MDNRGEFSYISPEKEKKSAARLLIIELIVVAIAIFVILGLLEYSGIFKISRVLQPPSLQNQGTVVTNKPTQPRVPDILVNSEVSGYTVVLENKEGLINFLASMGVFNQPQDWGSWGNTAGQKLTTINVALVPEEVRENTTVGPDGKIYSGATVQLWETAASIRIYIDPAVLADKNETSDEKGDRFLAAFFTPLYRARFPRTQNEPTPASPTLFETIAELSEEDYFRIESR